MPFAGYTARRTGIAGPSRSARRGCPSRGVLGGQPRLNRTRLHRGAAPFQPARAPPGRGVYGVWRCRARFLWGPEACAGRCRPCHSVAMLGWCACLWEPVGWAFAGCAQRALAAPAAARRRAIARFGWQRPRTVSDPPPACPTRGATSSPQANPSAACTHRVGHCTTFVIQNAPGWVGG